MEKGTDKKHQRTSHGPTITHIHHGKVQMSHGPPMHGQIPVTPKNVDIIGVPPVVVEIPIGEMQQLADQVQKRVKQNVEHGEPGQMIGNLKIITNILIFIIIIVIKILTANFNNLSVARVQSMLLNGTREFLTDGIIHC